MPNGEMLELYERTNKFIRPIHIIKLSIKYKWQTGLTYEDRGNIWKIVKKAVETTTTDCDTTACAVILGNIWKIVKKAVETTTTDCDTTACAVIWQTGSKPEKMAVVNASSMEKYYDRKNGCCKRQ
ncbi:hypothetical protein QE152_g1743 [Popillia japonica]|uniref:Uncharacterized protein n=1 Tax=Popillia japonica TaxID=7064 RepID=A0AAW1N5C5_POPJA